jgi:hypothetical protein
MTFSRIRTPGSWTDGSTVAGAEWEDFDENLSRAIDGENGGTYSLQSSLVIGSSGAAFITFYTELVVGDNMLIGADPSTVVIVNSIATFESDATFDAPLVCNDDATFNGPVTFVGDIAVNGDLLVGNSGSDALNVNASATFFAPVIFASDVELNGNATFNGLVILNNDVRLGSSGSDTTTVYGGLTFSGNGKILHRQLVISTNADQSIVGAHYDTVYIPDGALTGAKTLTIDDTGGRDGMRILFKSDETDVGDVANVVVPTVSAHGIANVVGRVKMQLYERIAGVWREIDALEVT